MLNSVTEAELATLELILLVVVVVCRHIKGQRSVRTALESSFGARRGSYKVQSFVENLLGLTSLLVAAV